MNNLSVSPNSHSSFWVKNMFVAASILYGTLPVGGISLLQAQVQTFESYPYLQKAYKEEKKKNWPEVQALMEHLLSREADNKTAKTLLIRAFLGQNKYKEAEAMAEKVSSDPEGSQQLQNIRTTMLSKGLVQENVLSSWLKKSKDNDKTQLINAYIHRLASTQNPDVALNWLEKNYSQNDSRALRKTRSVLAEKCNKNDVVIDALSPLLASHQLGRDDLRRLGMAYINNLDPVTIDNLLPFVSRPEDKKLLATAFVFKAIAQKKGNLAETWLKHWENIIGHSSDIQEMQWNLAVANNNVPEIIHLSGSLRKPCLDTVEVLADRDADAARKMLRSCDIGEQPKAWLYLAERLQDQVALENHPLSSPWEKQRRLVLARIYVKKHQEEKALQILPLLYPDIDIILARALLLEKHNRFREATIARSEIYKLNPDTDSLDHLTYDQVNAEEYTELLQTVSEHVSRSFSRHYTLLPLSVQDRFINSLSKNMPLIQKWQASKTEPLLASLDYKHRAIFVGNVIPHISSDQEISNLCRMLPPHESNPDPDGDTALGHCAMAQHRPGEAAIYFSEVQRERSDIWPVLVYALSAAGDTSKALEVWREYGQIVPSESLATVLARDALQEKDFSSLRKLIPDLTSDIPDNDILKAKLALHDGEERIALSLASHVMASNPSIDQTMAAIQIADKAGNYDQALNWLQSIWEKYPDNADLKLEYGMRVAGLPERKKRLQALPLLKDSSKLQPNNIKIGESLAWLFLADDDRPAAMRQLEQLISLPQNFALTKEDQKQQVQQRYMWRRTHADLSRRDHITLASIWSPAGIGEVVGNNQLSSSRRGVGQNMQMGWWDHAISDSLLTRGKGLAVYGRFFIDGPGRTEYAAYLGGAAGVRYKPFSRLNLNLYAEVFDQYTRYSLLASSHHKYPTKGPNSNTVDMMIRASASFFDQGDFRNDWREDRSHWNERFLYLDGAWWVHKEYFQGVARYQQGHSWKLPINQPQTIMPYGFGQFSSQNNNHLFREDFRAGAGIRWQYWFNETPFNAYRSALTVNIEYQRGLAGSLYERANGVLFSVGVRL
uniref:Bacteriophage N4 adsorption NfrA-like protein n=1 Tax=Zymomonas mobilis subsp. mobilis str. CP4 = NRRL B-14023 TaxID=627343 RepID=B3GN82_ZYMMB|nr:bacteriophage N4 adsorption NfrA precursor-like protein [Zymomonas mobilis]ACE07209.1 bacteriophage N4 adsorption NfrA precursor-like protein [Zymomonas mobilis subsp. mobilis str. CP4 = NRRL B-14023]